MAEIALKVKSDTQQAQNDIKKFGATLSKEAEKAQKFSESYKTTQIDKFINKNKNLSNVITMTDGKLAGLSSEAKGLQREMMRLVRKGMDPQDASMKRLAADHDRLQKEIRKTKRETRKLSEASLNLIKSFIKVGSVTGIIYSFGRGLGFVVDKARQVEDVRAAFTPLMGGAKQAEELVKQLNITAASTPFQFDDISKAAKQLLPVMNQDIKKTIETFKMLGDTAGGNAQKLDSITRGYTKAMLKGKVDMESLNMIAEAGVPIFTEMAKTMGFSKSQMSQFFKAVSSGKVSTDVLIETFKNMTTEGGVFYRGMIIASKTTSGVLSTMKDNVGLLAASIGAELLPYIKSFALWVNDTIKDIIVWANENDNLKNVLKAIGGVLKNVAQFVGIGAAVWGVYTIATKSAAFATNLFAKATGFLNKSLKANPVGLVIAAITGLIFLLKKLSKESQGVKVLFDFLANSIGAVVKSVGKLLSLIGKAIEALKITSVTKAFSALEQKIAKEALPTFEKLINKMGGLEEAQRRAAAGSLYAKSVLFKYEQVLKRAGKSQEVLSKIQMLSKNIHLDDAAAMKKNAEATGKYNADKKKSYMDFLNSIPKTQQQIHNDMLNQSQEFFAKRAELQSEDIETRIQYLQDELMRVNEIKGLDDKKRLATEKGLRKAIEAEQKKQTQIRVQFGQSLLDSTANLLTSLQTIFENAGKKSHGLAVAMKAIAVAQALINSYLAYTVALKSFPPPFNFVAAGVALAAGLAQSVAIATTPIPSAQTGIDYTVPDTRSNRFDRAAVNASAGERVTVTPRGEEDEKMSVDIRLNESVLFRAVQKGLNKGKIKVNNKNIGRTAFAT